ncbi:MAG: hypothetical protein IKR57_05885 [Bacilli bacterium]|nr:hypothetical protein [Bacilli bacterium]
MIREELTKRDFKRIIKELNGGYIYNDHGRMIKFDYRYLDEMKKYRQLISAFGDINPEQIAWLSSVNVKKSYLPSGIVSYDRTPVGVIYPHFFEGYKPLTSVSSEDSELMINNLTSAIENNLELIDNGIVNADFAAKNVLYKGSRVELIDLSGKHIKRGLYTDSYQKTYSYFLPDLYRIIGNKLTRLYGVDEARRIVKELVIMNGNRCERETPLEIIDNVKKMRVLK